MPVIKRKNALNAAKPAASKKVKNTQNGQRNINVPISVIMKKRQKKVKKPRNQKQNNCSVSFLTKASGACYSPSNGRLLIDHIVTGSNKSSLIGIYKRFIF